MVTPPSRSDTPRLLESEGSHTIGASGMRQPATNFDVESMPCSVPSSPSQTSSRRLPRFPRWRIPRDIHVAISEGLGHFSVDHLVTQPRIFVQELRRPQHKPVDSEEVYASERRASAARFARLANIQRDTEPRPFSVALSGGGVRAAAFSLGVIWRLAERGRMKDIEHLSVVSGGAYVGTAFATFLLEAITKRLEHPNEDGHIGQVPTSDVPPCTGDLDEWYLSVVWQLIERMQVNAGFLVRFGRNPCKRKGARPAAQGLACIVFVLLLGCCILPSLNFLCVVVPLALVIEVAAGQRMRRFWCEPSEASLVAWTKEKMIIVASLFATAIILQGLVILCKRRALCPRDGRPLPKGIVFVSQLLFSAKSAILCFAAFALVVVVSVWTAIGLQWIHYGSQADCKDIWRQPSGSAVFVLWHVWLSINVSIIALGMLGSCLKWPILVLRRNHIAPLLLPMWATFFSGLLVRWRVFGMIDEGEGDFHKHWHTLMNVVLCLAIFMLPIYGQLRQMTHVYYRRSLRSAFYSGGVDRNFSEACDVSLCPNLIVAATLMDYCRLRDVSQQKHYSEFFFTAKWMGGDRTGFIETPEDMKLSTVMAVSGAAIDAFLLTKLDSIWVRVTVLGLFNLFMGDYIEFKSSTKQGLWCGRIQALGVNLFFVAFFVLLYFSTGSGESLEDARLFWGAWAMLWILVFSSFFASFKGLRWVLSSVIIRHLHMAMMHYHIADKPPLRLFLNDGGLVECLGLISLLRRRCEFMLATDSTADFSMQLVCLRDTMHLAQSERLCTFFDPSDPRRGVEPLLQEFSAGTSSFLRIGVLYDCWSHRCSPFGASSSQISRERSTGEIFFVRMRLAEVGQLVQFPRITQVEVLQHMPPQMESTESSPITHVSAMNRERLGGCCCDCCHLYCNCGLMGRFPDIANSNQFLTPTQFALFCRLGYELSKDAIDMLTRSQAEGENREPNNQ